METCSFYSEESSISLFSILLYLIFVAVILFNIYLINTIFFRSSQRMSTYKWYLLLHQGASASTDILVRFVHQLAYSLR